MSRPRKLPPDVQGAIDLLARVRARKLTGPEAIEVVNAALAVPGPDGGLNPMAKKLTKTLAEIRVEITTNGEKT